MLTIIPAIDIIEGKCVRLTKGDYSRKKIYNEDPLEVARAFEDHGLERLHLVDLDGARTKHIVNWKVLERIATETKLIIDYGGGIKEDHDIRIVFECGAVLATIGSVAATNKNLFLDWLKKYGSERIILGADVDDRKIAVTGWLEKTELDIMQFIEDFEKEGVTNVLCTDISKDGMMEGTSLELYKEIVHTFPNVSLIASGGIISLDEIYALEEMGVAAAVIGKAIYEGMITLNDLQNYVLLQK